MTTFTVDTILVGTIRPLGARAAPSGIVKSPVAGPVMVGTNGVDGDHQGDLRVHGGPEKVVHHYPFDHYEAWRGEIGDDALLAAPGAFGENVSATGLTEEAVAIGDVFRWGQAVVEVSQGRQPCWKLNERFGNATMARRVQETGRTGWYYRVLQPGMVSPGDSLTLTDRNSPDWTLSRIWHAFYIDRLNLEELQGIATLERLGEGWRKHARRRLETRSVEDWTKRLTGRDAV